MTLSKERIVAIVACLYGKKAEIVETIGERFIDYGIVFEGNDLSLNWQEVECLIENDIIECDGGNAEDEEERRIYILTENAHNRIKEIVQNNSFLRL